MVGALAIYLGSVFEGNIKAVWKTLGSYSAACLLFPVLITYIFPKKISDNQFLLAVSAGTLAVTYHRLIRPILDIDDFYVGILFTAVTLGLWSVLKSLFKKHKYL